ncbi:hypothetical protein EWM64_g1141 [Hericium alpestre]|uniref:Large ribosomal subunit protein mL46 n=1 Tax=Hericium alpestre TaxID=135208 RepID=A0A4Z0A995_9AGAM|nr:hypothetical protein EWM64_g1141 [Hericium alpestre]
MSNIISSSCRRNIKARPLSFFRGIATQEAASTSASAPPTPSLPRKKAADKAPQPVLQTSVILNRSPIITRTPTPFERAYFAYQARIQRALHNPFPHELYFKPGSLLEARFNAEERRRDRKAFGPGFGADAESAKEKDVGATEKQFGQEEEENTVSRVHASDLSGDVKSLDRNGQRNVYLLLKKTEGGKEVWTFPRGGVQAGELLHQAAERELASQCGEAMDTWIVGRHPIGLAEIQSATPPAEPSGPSKTSVFFFKAHILSGQVTLDGQSAADFAWLTKEEISERVDPAYWNDVKDMLSDF